MDWLAAWEEMKRPDYRFRPVYVLHGEEPVLMDRFIAGLREKWSSANDPAGIERFDFEEQGCADALLACQTVSLFGTPNLVVLQHCTALAAAQTRQKPDTGLLEDYLENPVPGRILVITVAANKLDERKRLTKLAKQHAVISCNTPKDETALKILASFATERGITITSAALRELWHRRPSLSLCDQELDKLWAYADGQPIDVRQVEEAVSPPLEDNVFSWIDGVVSGRLDQALGALADLYLTGQDPMALLALVARQLRLMWYARTYGDQGLAPQEIAARTGAHPYALRVASQQARRLRAEEIESLITLVADAEFFIKTGRRETRQALEWVVLSCAARVHRGRMRGRG